MNRFSFIAACLSLLLIAVSFACQRSPRALNTATATPRVAIYPVGVAPAGTYIASLKRVLLQSFAVEVELLEGEDESRNAFLDAVAAAASDGSSYVALVQLPTEDIRGLANRSISLEFISVTDQSSFFSADLPFDARFETLLEQSLQAEVKRLPPVSDDTTKLIRYLEDNKRLQAASLVRRRSQDESGEEVAKVSDAASEQADAGKYLQLEFVDINRDSQQLFRKALQEQRLSAAVSRYRSGTSRLVLRGDKQGEAWQLTLFMPFDGSWYHEKIRGDKRRSRGYPILHLKPYYSLMYKLIALKGSFFQQARSQGEPSVQRLTEISSILSLTKGEAFVDLVAEVGETGKLIYPTSLRLRLADFEFDYEVASMSVYERTGFFSLDKRQGNLNSKRAAARSALIDFFQLKI